MAGSKYHGDGFQALIADLNNPDSAISVTVNASTAHRFWVYEIYMANVGTPADLTSVYYVGQVTAPGSATTVTATQQEDGADVVSRSVLNVNHTVEPTYVAFSAGTGLRTPADGDIMRVVLNHRATYRWVAPPGGEKVAPATSTRGFGVAADHSSATTPYMIGMDWIE
jgi:hypothetical protein